MSSRGRSQQDFAARLLRAADEQVGTSAGGRGGGGSLGRAELEEVVAAAVEQAFTRLRPAPVEGDPVAPAVAQQLTDVLSELRNVITNVASPAQGTVVVKKAKRYELGQSTSREKVRPSRAAARKHSAAPTQTLRPNPPPTAPAAQTLRPHRLAPRASAGDAGCLHAAFEARTALQTH